MNIFSVGLPPWCADVIANPPQSGEGFHRWLFRAARALWKCGRTENDIRAFLENAALTCGRPVSVREIDDALTNSRTATFQYGVAQRRAWPAVNHEQREAIIESGLGLVDMWERSPIRFDDKESRTEKLVDQLFPGDPLLCCGRSQTYFDTKTRSQWRGELSALQFIVPSPMSAVTGFTKTGRESKHSLCNTGPRHFLAVEFDTGKDDDHAALLLELAKQAPLALAMHSGGKSLHGWFYCHGQSETRIEVFMRHAVSLGADPATWTRSQFVRMPDGIRHGGRRQTVFFFNPKVIG